MGELNSNLLTLGMREFNDVLESEFVGDLAVEPDSRVFGCDASFGDDGCGFDYGEAGTARDDATEMGHVPGCEVAILGGVLAEGREEDAVLEGGAADLEGCECFWDWFRVWLLDCGAGGRDLGGCEVGDLLVLRDCLERRERREEGRRRTPLAALLGIPALWAVSPCLVGTA